MFTTRTLVRVTTPQGRRIVGVVVENVRGNKVRLSCSGTEITVTATSFEYVPVGTRQGWVA